MHSIYKERILNTQLFNGINENELEAIIGCVNPAIKKYNKGEYIYHSDQEVDNIGLIVEGEVFISKTSYLGNSIVISHLKSGSVFGAMIAFSNNQHSPSDVIANDNTVILLLPKYRIIGQCSNMCQFHQRLIRNFLNIVSERAIELNKKVELLTIKSIKGKIALFLLEESKKGKSMQIELSVNRNQLAEYLSVSRPSMSRELSEMQSDGLLTYNLNKFTIIDLEGLKILAEQ